MEKERSIDRLARYIIAAGTIAILAWLCWYFKNVLVYIIAAFVVSLIGQPVMKRLRKITVKGKAAPDWLLAILTILVIYVTMVYGPIAAILVEMFPTRIRYTSMSLPYHIGNGWFGGFLPAISFGPVAASGDIYKGLWYPIIIAAINLVAGLFFLRETKDVDISK